jgi:hypothetical protein
MSVPALDSWCDDDLHAWPVLSPLIQQGGYLPWTTGSMRPAGLVKVCNEIVHGARTRIVECGSGVSTVLLARLLRERQSGALVAVEHDRHWAEVIQSQLERERLSSIAQVIYAPLQGEASWYGLAGRDEIPDQVDLLIVDGPPAFEPRLGASRAPALPWFSEHLVADAAVVLDDIDRPGEQAVITRWEGSTAWRFVRHERAGVAIGRRDAEGRLNPSSAAGR